MATKNQPEKNSSISNPELYFSEMKKEEMLEFSRVLNAPRKLVYKAFSGSAALAQWWGPKGCSINIVTFDFRPGGIFHYNMEMNGKVMWGKFRYLEIVEPERIVFVNSFSDEDGNVTPNPFLPTFPLEIMNIVTFTEHDGKTTLAFRGRPINATETEQQTFRDMNSSMQQGFAGTFDALEEYLAK